MHPEQEAAHRQVVEGVDILANSLMRLYDLDEDDALETVRSLPELVDKIQDNKLRELFEVAAKRARPKIVKFNRDENPGEYYPGHPKFMPNITTKTTYNEHVAQAMFPYIKAIMEKTAKDRGIKPPATHVVQAVVEKTDWARAAYEAKRMPPKPPPSQIRRFLKKYLGPVESRITRSTSTLFGLASSATMLWLAWQAFKGAAENTGAPMKSFTPFSHASQHRAQDKMQRKLRIPKRFRSYKTY